MNAPENSLTVLKSRLPTDLDQVFIEIPGDTSLSFSDIETLSGKFANLLATIGINPGDRVAVQVEKSPEAICLYLACLQHGAIFLPMNTAYQMREVEHILKDASPRLIVCSPHLLNGMTAISQKLTSAQVLTLGPDADGSFIEQARRLKARNDVFPARKDDVACILYTSGTTGQPKGAMITHENLASNTLALHDIWQFRADDVLLHALPIFHAHGLFVAINLSLYNASRVIFLRAFDVDNVLTHLKRSTVFMGVPTFYTRLLGDDRFTRAICHNMRLFIAGSAPLTEETFHRFFERIGRPILERYGMTETLMNTSNPIGGERAGSCGIPLPGVEVRIADEAGNALQANEIGMIEVRGPNVFKGYWNRSSIQDDFRSDGFFITGDVGQMDKNGYVWIQGRAKDLIISGGFNVYPKEVESCLDKITGITESAVFGVPHPDFGEGVLAAVTCEDKLTSEAIIEELREQMASYKLPKKIFFLDDLPRNAMGKVQKNILREKFADSFKKPT